MQPVTKETLGEKLVKCIQIGNKDSERHKGRARLIRKPTSRTLSAERIEADIQNSILALNRKPVSFYNSIYFVEELDELADKADSMELNCEEVSNAICVAINAKNPSAYFQSEQTLQALGQKFREVAFEVRSSPGYGFNTKKGRKLDHILYAFIIELTCIFEEYSKFRATATERKDGSGMGSPFYEFVTTILKAYPENAAFQHWLEHNGTLNGAIRNVASFQGHDDYDPIHHEYLFDVEN